MKSRLLTKLCDLEAKSLRKDAIKLFNEIGFSSDWDTNFSTGDGSYAELDLLILKLVIEKHKPKNILELGSGKSTLAMNIFAEAVGYIPFISSMDEYEKWGMLTCNHILSAGYQENTEVIISSRVQGAIDFFNGTHYASIPDREYDFIFVDGPDPEGGVCLDVIYLLSKQRRPCNVLIDGRFRTVFALESMCPSIRVDRFINNMTFIRGLSSLDFKDNNFSHMHFKSNYFSLIRKSISAEK